MAESIWGQIEYSLVGNPTAEGENRSSYSREFLFSRTISPSKPGLIGAQLHGLARANAVGDSQWRWDDNFSGYSQVRSCNMQFMRGNIELWSGFWQSINSCIIFEVATMRQLPLYTWLRTYELPLRNRCSSPDLGSFRRQLYSVRIRFPHYQLRIRFVYVIHSLGNFTRCPWIHVCETIRGACLRGLPISWWILPNTWTVYYIDRFDFHRCLWALRVLSEDY